MRIAQVVLRDNQEFNYKRFILSELFFTSLEQAREYYRKIGPEYSVVEVYEPSVITDEYTVSMVLKTQKRV